MHTAVPIISYKMLGTLVLAAALILGVTYAYAGEAVTLCHATGSETNPYEEITVSYNGWLHGHEGHAGDIMPVPLDGCPSEGGGDPLPS